MPTVGTRRQRNANQAEPPPHLIRPTQNGRLCVIIHHLVLANIWANTFLESIPPSVLRHVLTGHYRYKGWYAGRLFTLQRNFFSLMNVVNTHFAKNTPPKVYLLARLDDARQQSFTLFTKLREISPLQRKKLALQSEHPRLMAFWKILVAWLFLFNAFHIIHINI